MTESPLDNTPPGTALHALEHERWLLFLLSWDAVSDIARPTKDGKPSLYYLRAM